MRLVFDPVLPPVQTATLALAATLAAVWIYARSLRATAGLLPVRGVILAALRTTLACGLAVILLNPVMVAGRTRPAGKTPLVLLLDTSRSMRTPDGEGGATRFEEAARRTIRDPAFLQNLRRRFDVRVYGFAEKPRAGSPESLGALASPDGRTTSLGAALAEGGNRAEGGRILLVSDGRETADSYPLDAARALQSRGIAVDTLCVGKQTVQTDIEVVARKSQVYAAPSQTVEIGGEIRGTGRIPAAVRVKLTEGGRTIASQMAAVRKGRADVRFRVSRARKGAYRLALQADAAPRERNRVNNRAGVTLNVLNTEARVLFLEGRPTWDSKFLAQALRADSSIKLDMVYKLTDAKFFAVLADGAKETGIALPRTADAFSRYDVLIFGRGFEEFYDDSTVRALKEWVSERGGNVLFLRGRADDRTPALREMEPVNWSGQEIDQIRMRLTDEGKAHPGFAFDAREDAQTVVHRMPPLVSASRVQGEKALAVVLARAEGAPDDSAKEMATLAYLRYGSGKSMAVVGQGMWRWAFLPPELEGYGRVYQEFWSQVIRWMVSDSDFLPGQKAAIRTDRSTYAPGDTVSLLGYARVKGGPLPARLRVTLPDGTRTEIAAARADGKVADFTALYRPGRPGEYTVSLQNAGAGDARASCTFTVAESSEEDMNTSADPDLMRRLASVGGGISLSPGDVRGLPDRLAALEREPSRESRAEPRASWDRSWFLACLLAAAGLEWWLRRRWGLA